MKRANKLDQWSPEGAGTGLSLEKDSTADCNIRVEEGQAQFRSAPEQGAESKREVLLMNQVSSTNPQVLIKEFWEKALQTVAPLDLSPQCSQTLWAWITMAVERMENEGRLQGQDVALAEANLQTFIKSMKTEALYLGHADRLDHDAFRSAHRHLERKALLTPVSLWPFWPNEFWRA